MDGSWIEYPRAGNATYISVHRRRTRESGEVEVIASSAERFHEKGVEDIVKSARENAESLKCRQVRGKYACMVFTISVSFGEAK